MRQNRIRYDLRLLRPPMDERIEIAPAPIRATDDPDDLNYDPESLQILHDITDGDNTAHMLACAVVILAVGLVGFLAFFVWRAFR